MPWSTGDSLCERIHPGLARESLQECHVAQCRKLETRVYVVVTRELQYLMSSFFLEVSLFLARLSLCCYSGVCPVAASRACALVAG